MRIALLTHSTNPRGGVVHAMELGEALHDLGHQVVLHAPDPGGTGFFRSPRCGSACIPAEFVNGNLGAIVRQRMADYVAYFESRAGDFDLFHAQDSISANALADLVDRGLIPGYVRTVHHLDEFADPFLQERQTRSILSARKVLCVSRTWAQILRRDCGVLPEEVSNGVNTIRYHPARDAADRDRDAAVAKALDIAGSPVFLSIGGIEPRKNTQRTLEAFLNLLPDMPGARLVIVGGASLLDHSAYRMSFESLLHSASDEERSAVRLLGVVPDADLPSLLRLADALVFPSVKEGFGLVVLEAMASGTPAITSCIAPFTEYLGEKDAIWCDPFHVKSIAAAMKQASEPDAVAHLRQSGPILAAGFSWARSARRHADIYTDVLKEFSDA